MRNKQLSRGFTIVELLIVVVIIGILAALVITAWNGVTQRSKDAALASDTAQAKKQIEAFYAVNGSYPTANNCTNTAATEICLKTSPGNLLTYTFNGNTASPPYTLNGYSGVYLPTVASSVSTVIATGGSGITTSFGTYCTATAGVNGGNGGSGSGTTGALTSSGGNGSGSGGGYIGGGGGGAGGWGASANGGNGSGGGGGGGAGGTSSGNSGSPYGGGWDGSSGGAASGGGSGGGIGTNGSIPGGGGGGGSYGGGGGLGADGRTPLIGDATTLQYPYGGGGGGGGGYGASGRNGGTPGGGGAGAGYAGAVGIGGNGKVIVWEYSSTDATGTPVSMQVFNVSGTWLRPGSVNSIRVLVIGAGGNGVGYNGGGGGGSCNLTARVI